MRFAIFIVFALIFRALVNIIISAFGKCRAANLHSFFGFFLYFENWTQSKIDTKMTWRISFRKYIFSWYYKAFEHWNQFFSKTLNQSVDLRVSSFTVKPRLSNENVVFLVNGPLIRPLTIQFAHILRAHYTRRGVILSGL